MNLEQELFNIYRRILLELGEVLQGIQTRLNVEDFEPIDLKVDNWRGNGIFLCKLKRAIGNVRDGEKYVSPYILQTELQDALDRRRISGLSATGTLRLYIRVTEDRSRFYQIFVKARQM